MKMSAFGHCYKLGRDSIFFSFFSVFLSPTIYADRAGGQGYSKRDIEQRSDIDISMCTPVKKLATD